MQPVSLSEHKDALVLHLKYHKTTLFIACQPSTTVASLKTDFIEAVRTTNQPELSTLPQYTADGREYPAWSKLDPEEDVGLFIASRTGADESMIVFMPLDQDSASSDLTVRKAGLKDSDAVCVGFRAQGACKCHHILAGWLFRVVTDLFSSCSHCTFLFVPPSQPQSPSPSSSSPTSKRTKKTTSIPTRFPLLSPARLLYTFRVQRWRLSPVH